jgi:hypothetical protein
MLPSFEGVLMLLGRRCVMLTFFIRVSLLFFKVCFYVSDVLKPCLLGYPSFLLEGCFYASMLLGRRCVF